jgi:TIGR03009 family protein
MRRALAVAGILVLAGLLPAQPPAGVPSSPPAPASNARLDEVLREWERVMSSITSLVAQCTRTRVDKTYQTVEVYDGVAKYLRVGKTNYASLELYKRGRRDIFEKFICSGEVVYEYAPQSREIRVHPLPKPPPGQVAEDNLVSFLFGMPAAEAKRRYQLTWVPPPANDHWYYYLDVLPRESRDQQEFQRARLVLVASTYLPRRLWFQEANGNEITWDFPQVQTGVALNPQEFTRPALPAGWQWRQVPPPGPARIVRPQQ